MKKEKQLNQSNALRMIATPKGTGAIDAPLEEPCQPLSGMLKMIVYCS